MISAFSKFFKISLLFTFLLCVFIVPFLGTTSIGSANYPDNFLIKSNLNFAWPIPGYTDISSPFGYRVSPTSGASTYHSGIDLPAPEGTNLYAIANGNVIFASWGAGGGYTITYELTEHPDIKVSYCHVSPIMYVSYGDKITKGQNIGTVGPTNVYGIVNNPYTDEDGNPTNGASTGCHLHFTIKVDNSAVNPLNYYSFE